jgi:hypothetical protein
MGCFAAGSPGSDQVQIIEECLHAGGRFSGNRPVSAKISGTFLILPEKFSAKKISTGKNPGISTGV